MSKRKMKKTFNYQLGDTWYASQLLFKHKYHEAQLLKAKVKDLQVNNSH
jgi:hypothetical protein